MIGRRGASHHHSAPVHVHLRHHSEVLGVFVHLHFLVSSLLEVEFLLKFPPHHLFRGQAFWSKEGAHVDPGRGQLLLGMLGQVLMRIQLKAVESGPTKRLHLRNELEGLFVSLHPSN